MKKYSIINEICTWSVGFCGLILILMGLYCSEVLSTIVGVLGVSFTAMIKVIDK